MPRTIRSFAVALVLLVLAAGAAQARPLAGPAPAGFFDSLWEWVASYLPVWNKAGGMMDPDGLKAGSDMDPNGLKEGGTMDPDGARLQLPSPSTSDAGGTMDPDG
ncbi:MAG TPA: hypothetical protein VKK31_24520 [Thermoanaerobaculia bacterium]|nr:hypothetical protein [Thermoanaerobaculia bacterium]